MTELCKTDTQLIANGYEPVACVGKRSLGNKWSTRQNTIEAINAERAALPNATNTGLRTGPLVGVDNDIKNMDHAAQVDALKCEVLGETPLVRLGAKGSMSCFRNSAPIGKITVVAKDGTKIEILGVGQQFVAYGDHPDTGKPYKWIKSDDLGVLDPLSVPLADLPVVTPAQLYEFGRRAKLLMEKLGYKEVKIAGDMADGGKLEKSASLSKGKPVSAAHLQEILSYIDPGVERGPWRDIVAAIRATPIQNDEDESIRRQLAHEWSEGRFDHLGRYKDKFPEGYTCPEDIDQVFDTMPPRADGVGYGTIYKLAKDAGYKGPPYRPDAAETFSKSVSNIPVKGAAAEGQAVSEIVSAVPGSEDDLALHATQIHGRNLRYVGDWNKWLWFDGRRWVEIKVPAIWNLLRPLVRDYAARLSDLSPAARRKFAGKATIANVEALARGADGILISADMLDADSWLLNTPDGIVDLRTGELRSSDPMAYCTKSTAVSPGGECPLWLKFLHRITDGDIDRTAFLQRMAGYALTGITSEHAMFFFIGSGANGKGVFLNTLTNIYNDYATVAPVDTFTASRNDRHPTDLAMFRNARLVSAQETNEGRQWDEAKVKALTGGDKISARFMHQDFFTYIPQFKLLIASNHKPKLHNVDEAIKRRLHIIPFSVTIPEAERDHDLPEKLKAEWPGILRWAIEGCLEWQKKGLAPPAAVREATRGYFDAQDPLSGWIETRCIREPNAWTASGGLYIDYCDYMTRENELPDGRKRFFERMESHGFKPVRRGQDGARGFVGLSLLPVTPTWQDDVVQDKQKGES